MPFLRRKATQSPGATDLKQWQEQRAAEREAGGFEAALGSGMLDGDDSLDDAPIGRAVRAREDGLRSARGAPETSDDALSEVEDLDDELVDMKHRDTHLERSFEVDTDEYDSDDRGATPPRDEDVVDGAYSGDAQSENERHDKVGMQTDAGVVSRVSRKGSVGGRRGDGSARKTTKGNGGRWNNRSHKSGPASERENDAASNRVGTGAAPVVATNSMLDGEDDEEDSGVFEDQTMNMLATIGKKGEKGKKSPSPSPYRAMAMQDALAAADDQHTLSDEVAELKAANAALLERIRVLKRMGHCEQETSGHGDPIDVRDKKIVELCKQKRALQVKLNRERANAATFEAKFGELKKGFDVFKSAKDTEIGTLKKKLRSAVSLSIGSLGETRVSTAMRAENQRLREELALSTKVIMRETGLLPVEVKSLMHSGGTTIKGVAGAEKPWSGRGEIIHKQQAKLAKLRERMLLLTGPSDGDYVTDDSMLMTLERDEYDISSSVRGSKGDTSSAATRASKRNAHTLSAKTRIEQRARFSKIAVERQQQVQALQKEIETMNGSISDLTISLRGAHSRKVIVERTNADLKSKLALLVQKAQRDDQLIDALQRRLEKFYDGWKSNTTSEEGHNRIQAQRDVTNVDGDGGRGAGRHGKVSPKTRSHRNVTADEAGFSASRTGSVGRRSRATRVMSADGQWNGGRGGQSFAEGSRGTLGEGLPRIEGDESGGDDVSGRSSRSSRSEAYALGNSGRFDARAARAYAASHGGDPDRSKRKLPKIAQQEDDVILVTNFNGGQSETIKESTETVQQVQASSFPSANTSIKALSKPQPRWKLDDESAVRSVHDLEEDDIAAVRALTVGDDGDSSSESERAFPAYSGGAPLQQDSYQSAYAAEREQSRVKAPKTEEKKKDHNEPVKVKAVYGLSPHAQKMGVAPDIDRQSSRDMTVAGSELNDADESRLPSTSTLHGMQRELEQKALQRASYSSARGGHSEGVESGLSGVDVPVSVTGSGEDVGDFSDGPLRVNTLRTGLSARQLIAANTTNSAASLTDVDEGSNADGDRHEIEEDEDEYEDIYEVEEIIEEEEVEGEEDEQDEAEEGATYVGQAAVSNSEQDGIGEASKKSIGQASQSEEAGMGDTPRSQGQKEGEHETAALDASAVDESVIEESVGDETAMEEDSESVHGRDNGIGTTAPMNSRVQSVKGKALRRSSTTSSGSKSSSRRQSYRGPPTDAIRAARKSIAESAAYSASGSSIGLADD